MIDGMQTPSDTSELVRRLRALLGPDGVVEARDALGAYELDASHLDGVPPAAVALPRTPEQLAEVVRLTAEAGLPVVARGAGTGISGGAIPPRGGVVVSTARLDAVERVDPRSRLAVVQSGVVNLELTQRTAPLGFQFAPDPSSQRASTIGGNIAENAGGPHCLKYGVTTNHVLALELVLHDGTRLWTGDGVADRAGYDLTGLVVGSEGTFAIVTRAIVRLSRLPEQNRVVLALFPDVVSAGAAVSSVIAAGHLPTSLEMMDANAIRAVNEGYGLGLPAEAGAALIVEVDGVADGLDEALAEIAEICEEHQAFDLRPAVSPEEQARVWTARKSVAGAIGRLAPAYYLVDTVVPRTRLPHMMEHVDRLSREHGLQVVNVFHAGDGNLHPLVLYDPRDGEQKRRAIEIAETVMRLSIEQGGVISGEHGVGAEKQEYLPLLFAEADLQAMAAVYAAFNPSDRLNPGKIFPAAMRPLELARQHRERLAAGRLETSDSPEQSLLSNLQSRLGAEHVLAGEHAQSYAAQGVVPDLVALPGTIDELSATMAACHRAGAIVVPWGGGTAQGLGARGWGLETQAPRPSVVISTRRLKRVVKYEPDDLTIGVEAGMTLAELQAILAEHGQMLPLDAPLADRATLGGLVATAADGPRRLGYGPLRDLLLSVTVVEVDGTVVRSGGQVVKNVSGYDLVKLFLGSHGTLGVIAALSLKTLPRPRAEGTVALGYHRREDLLALLDSLAASQLQPVAVEYLAGWDVDDARIRVASGGEAPEAPLAEMIWLNVRLEGLPAAVERHMRELGSLAARHNVAELRALEGERHAAIWAWVNDRAAADLSGDHALLRLGVLPGELGSTLAHVEERATAHGMRVAVDARALSGVIYLRASGPAAGLRGLHADLVARWRHCHLLACDPERRAGLPVWGAEPPGIELMRELKRAFDPYDRLNPGRYIV